MSTALGKSVQIRVIEKYPIALEHWRQQTLEKVKSHLKDIRRKYEDDKIVAIDFCNRVLTFETPFCKQELIFLKAFGFIVHNSKKLEVPVVVEGTPPSVAQTVFEENIQDVKNLLSKQIQSDQSFLNDKFPELLSYVSELLKRFEEQNFEIMVTTPNIATISVKIEMDDHSRYYTSCHGAEYYVYPLEHYVHNTCVHNGFTKENGFVKLEVVCRGSVYVSMEMLVQNAP